MYVHIERGRIQILLDPASAAEQLNDLSLVIGSLAMNADNPLKLTCALSVHNFRKLRRAGARLADDDHTKAVIAQLVARHQGYDQDTARGNLAKQGDLELPPYEFKLPPFAHQLRGWQFLHALATPALFGDCGTGKMQPVDTPVLTPSGWRSIGSLQIGDMVFGRNGRPYPVTAVYPQGIRPLFKVLFSDGSSTLAGGEHQWTVRNFNDEAQDRPWRVMTTYQLLATKMTYGRSSSRKRWRIPIVEPIQFERKDLPIDPYVLGVLLGDGCMLSGVPTWTSTDPEIAYRIMDRLPLGHEVRLRKSRNRAPTWSIVSSDPRWSKNKNIVQLAISNLGLVGLKADQKHIPQEFLHGDADQRLELLRGLLDTDGHAGSSIEFTSISINLITGVQFLVESLGGTSRISLPRETTYTYRGKKFKGKSSWRIHLALPPEVNPFSLGRKKVKRKKNISRTIKEISPAISSDSVCISVGSPDQTYVVERFIVTHNTFMVLTFADSLLKWGERWVFLVVCPVNLIRHVWIDDAAKFSDLKTISLREEPLAMRSSDWPAGADRSQPGARAQAKLALLKRQRIQIKQRFGQDADLYVINPENIRGGKEKQFIGLCKRKQVEGFKICLVIDESSKLKNRTSATYRALQRLRAECERCIIMTGTPSPNGVLDLWSQFAVLDGGQTLQPSFIDYRHEVARQITFRNLTFQGRGGKAMPVTKWEPRRESPLQVFKTIEPRMIRFRTEDCVDLPPRIFIMRNVEMNATQASVYADMEEMLFAEFEGAPITARVAAAKMLKLREITGGFIITDTGEAKALGASSPKMLELDDLLEQSIADKLGDEGPPNKALVWAQYQWECKSLVQRYAKRYGARGLFGGISAKAKDAAIHAFKTDPQARLLVCHPASAGHGLTLIDANYAFYYSLSYNFEEFYQSYRRMTRPGQQRTMTYYFLVAPATIDEDLMDALRAKKNLSDLITDGAFSRDALLARRKDTALTLSPDWEVPLEIPSDSGHANANPDDRTPRD